MLGIRERCKNEQCFACLQGASVLVGMYVDNFGTIRLF